MKIEVLFPEFCNLFGDRGNMKYLQMCIPNGTFVETSIKEEPVFMSEKVDLIYMGPMTENGQVKVIEKLKKYKEKLKELIENDVPMLFVGNALEVLGNYIEIEDGSKIEALGLVDVYAKRDIKNRESSLIIGQYEDMDIVGFKSQFTKLYGNYNDIGFIKLEKGMGLNPETDIEGFKVHNCIGTYIIGPILILNPLFTLKLLKIMGVKNPTLAIEDDIMEAYDIRLKEFKRLP